jgi:hypothetical protein
MMRIFNSLYFAAVILAIGSCKTWNTADTASVKTAAAGDDALIQEVEAQIEVLHSKAVEGPLATPQRQILDDPHYRGKDLLIFYQHKVAGCIRLPANNTDQCEYFLDVKMGTVIYRGYGQSLCQTISGADGFFGIACLNPETKMEGACKGVLESNGNTFHQSKLSMLGAISGPVYLGDELTFALPSYNSPNWSNRNYLKIGANLCDGRFTK